MTEANNQTLSAAFPNFNIEGALELVSGMPSILVKIMNMFYAQYKDTAVADMQKLLDAKDYPGASRHAHTLKGLAGSIGATRLQETCLNLEMICKSENPESGLEPALNRFNQDMSATLALLGSKLSQFQ